MNSPHDPHQYIAPFGPLSSPSHPTSPSHQHQPPYLNNPSLTTPPPMPHLHHSPLPPPSLSPHYPHNNHNHDHQLHHQIPHPHHPPSSHHHQQQQQQQHQHQQHQHQQQHQQHQQHQQQRPPFQQHQQHQQPQHHHPHQYQQQFQQQQIQQNQHQLHHQLPASTPPPALPSLPSPLHINSTHPSQRQRPNDDSASNGPRSPSPGDLPSSSDPPSTGVLYGPPEGALATSYVGSYTLYDTIGEGAFGKVKIAMDRRSNVRVAIKIMDKSEIRAQEFTAQVRREIYIMRCLKHRHIVRMNEVLTSDTKLYIVMELVTGGELFDRIENGNVSEDKARQYFQQLVDGVDFCHKKGVAHRDLKPENLLVDENGDIKITDFGFSSMKGMDVNTGLLYTQCGTPDYCAPEIIDSAQKGYTGAKVDAWSCGIILYALLCERLPFQEPNTDKLYDLILACNVKYPNSISHDARDLLENLLVRDPAQRFDLQKVKRHPWFLINYDGDDAKLIKKRPFFNKNQKDLSGSTPSSPMVPPSSSKDSLPIPTLPRSGSNGGNSGSQFPVYNSSVSGTDPPPRNGGAIVSSPSQFSTQPSESEGPTSPTYQQGNISNSGSTPSITPVPVPAPTSSSSSTPSGHLNQPQEPLMDAGTPRNIHTGSTSSRIREDPYTAFRPTSPATDPTMHIRVPTPPAQDVFTKVEDRPATPARRQHSVSSAAAFQAAASAAAMHSNGSSSSNNLNSSNGDIVPSVIAPILSRSPSGSVRKSSSNNNVNDTSAGSSIVNGGGVGGMGYGTASIGGVGGNGIRLSPTRTSSSAPQRSNGSLDSSGLLSLGDTGVGGGGAVVGGGGAVVGNGHRNDDSSSEPDSVEDYENKPAPLLEMPANPRQIIRDTDGRRPIQSLPVSHQPRQRSDLTGTSYAMTTGGEMGSSSLSALRPRRAYGRDGPNSGLLLDSRVLRMVTRSDQQPSSPPVVFSPSPVSSNPYDRFGAISPGFNAMRNGAIADDGMVNGGAGSSGNGPTHNSNMPWQSSSSIGYGSSRDDGSGFSNPNFSNEVLAKHLWNLMNKLRGTSEPANVKLSKDLRKDFNVISNEIKQLGKLEDIVHIFMMFLSFFEGHALSDMPASSPVLGPGHSLDDEFDGHDGESNHNGTGDYRLMGSIIRRTGTDISSEEEPLSLSPVAAESTGPPLSDLARRRNLSDLLTKWIKTADSRGSVSGVEDNGAEIEDQGQSIDLTELQKLIRDQQSGREESNLAEELLRLMNIGSDDGNSTSTYGGGGPPINLIQNSTHFQPGQSPPPPHVQGTRSHDSYTTQPRYLSNISSQSGGGGGGGGGGGAAAAAAAAAANGRSPANPVRSASNSNAVLPLPSEYVPGRFKEPNSMPARGRNGNDRQTGLSGRTDVPRPNSNVNGNGVTNGNGSANGSGSGIGGAGGDELSVGSGRGDGRDPSSHMANSMGMHDVPYYLSDRRGGMATKLRGVLQTMKAKNHRLGELNAQFKSRLPADEILRLLARVLQEMGGNVTVKKETKRKMKCQLPLQSNGMLHAGIELVALENGYTCVAFRRSRADKGRTDTESFHNFFERVRSRFIDEANAAYPSMRMTTANAASRRRRNHHSHHGHGGHRADGAIRHVSSDLGHGQNSVAAS